MSGAISQPRGHRLFARYACAPNARGYCGPPAVAGAGLEAVACGHGAGVDVPSLAARFSGAWPYQCLIADLAGIADPLDERVVRAYWTGNALTREINGRQLGELLLERFASQAGHYWSHLTPGLLDEVTPTHAFHVFGVYPWTRLLATGRDEPLHVLDSCRIRSAEVLEVRPELVLVRARALTWDGRQLELAEPADEEVTWRSARGAFTGPLREGACVALHWGHICDELGERAGSELDHWTELQIETTNQRLDPSARAAHGRDVAAWLR
ncbi:MAG: DUF6390 family protein [Solirubrobacteraceae bacterium]|nr:DUF6390 family protein [Solirubrobacteraceae bacterium]